MVPDLPVTTLVEASVSPSEDPARVAATAAWVLGQTGTLREARGKVTVEGRGTEVLVTLRDQFRDRRVRSAARRLLLQRREGDTTRLMLNRQAAAAGVASLCRDPQESPLGPLYVTVVSPRLGEVIDWMTSYAEG